MRFRLAACWIVLLLAALLPMTAAALPEAWPEPPAMRGEPVTFPSMSPFTPADIGPRVERTEGEGILYLPAGTAPASPVPAVVLLHGSGGISPAREPRYARQLAGMGVAALVVDSFASRRDKGTGYTERLLGITETMMAADAYAALAYLAARPGIDPRRVAVVGFSYGGLAAYYAASRQIAEALAPAGPRFAGHVAFYAPCIGEVADERTTGAPILLMGGSRDLTFDQARCQAVVDAERRGGSDARLVVYDAYHQWDGSSEGWNPSRGIRNCRLRLETDGSIRDARTGLAMTGKATRTLILTFCTDGDGYTIKGDPAVKERSTAELARFLNRIFGLSEAAG